MTLLTPELWLKKEFGLCEMIDKHSPAVMRTIMESLLLAQALTCLPVNPT